MQIGIGLPASGNFASADAIIKIARRAEELDYAAVWTFERVLRTTANVPVPGREGVVAPLPEVYKNVFDSLDTLAFVAAHTHKIKLGTSVVDALFQSPPQLAKRFATLDQLSNGRVIVGLGQGSQEAEYIATNTPLKRRGAGFEEYLHALRAVWGPDPVKFDGRFYKIPEANINPKPLQNPLPLLIGGSSHAALERAARVADGITPSMRAWDVVEHHVKTFHDGARALGRDVSKLHVVARLNTAPNANPQQPFGGSLEQIQEDIARAQAIGLTQVFWDMNWVNLSIDEQLKWMEALRKLFD
jgi:probable F420-dependent oxidoreductase